METKQQLQDLINELAAYNDRYTAEITAVLQQYRQDSDYPKMRDGIAEIRSDGIRFVNRWTAATRYRFAAIIFP